MQPEAGDRKGWEFMAFFLATFAVVSAVVLLAVLGTPLAFAPVPWPLAWSPGEGTGSAPALPFLMSILDWVFRSSWAGDLRMPFWKAASLAIWALGAVRLYSWLVPVSRGCAIAVAGAYIADPATRWASVSLRPEAAAASLWPFVAIELLRMADTKDEAARFHRSWILATLLALAFAFDFSSIQWLIPVAVGLWPWERPAGSRLRDWLRRVGQLAWRTGLLLLPLLLREALIDPGALGRELVHSWQQVFGASEVRTRLLEWFAAAFQLESAPRPMPRIFEAAVVVFWLLAFAMIPMTIRAAAWPLLRAQLAEGVQPDQRRVIITNAENHRAALAGFAPMASGMMAFAVSLLILRNEPAVWSQAYLHSCVWTWVAGCMIQERRFGVAYPPLPPEKRFGPRRPDMTRVFRTIMTWSSVLFGGFALASLTGWVLSSPSGYTWRTYRQWIGCIERSLLASASVTGTAPALRVWQTGAPDALGEIAARQSGFRTFYRVEAAAGDEPASSLSDYLRFLDAIVLTSHVPDRIVEPAAVRRGDDAYEGPEREQDRTRTIEGRKVAFGKWVRDEIGSQDSGWRWQVCQAGAFWAQIASKEPAR